MIWRFFQISSFRDVKSVLHQTTCECLQYEHLHFCLLPTQLLVSGELLSVI